MRLEVKTERAQELVEFDGLRNSFEPKLVVFAGADLFVDVRTVALHVDRLEELTTSQEMLFSELIEDLHEHGVSLPFIEVLNITFCEPRFDIGHYQSLTSKCEPSSCRDSYPAASEVSRDLRVWGSSWLQ